MATEKELVRFNIQNAKYALLDEEGKYGEPQPFGTSAKIAVESDNSEKVIYGDGKKIATIVSDKGKTVTLTLNDLCEDFEIAMGRRLKTKSGIAEIQQNATPTFALYYETQALMADGSYQTVKTWAYGMTSTSRPTEEYDQTEDDINESTFELEFEGVGTALTDEDGNIVTDDNGNEITCWQQTVDKDADDYDTYGDEVVLPVKAEE